MEKGFCEFRKKQLGLIILAVLVACLLSSCGGLYDSTVEMTIRTLLDKQEGKITTADLEKIEALELDNVQDLRDLGKLPNLRDISIRNSTVTKWDELYQRPFRSVEIWDNGTSVDISKLKKEKLEAISIKGAEIQKITSLKDAPNLKSITVWNMPNLDISFLRGIKGIKSLELVGCEQEDISFLEDFPNIENLTLDHNLIEDITPITTLKQLKKLDLHHNHIHDIAPLSEVSQLEILNLSENRINDIQSVGRMTELKECDFSRNRLTDIEALGQLKNLQVLRVEGNKIRSLRTLETMKEITEVFAADNQIDTLPQNIPATLSYFDLESNCVSSVEKLGTAKWNLFDNELSIEQVQELSKQTNIIFSSGDRELNIDEMILYIKNKNELLKRGTETKEELSMLYQALTSGAETEIENAEKTEGAYNAIAERKGSSRSFAFALQSLLRKSKMNSYIYQGERFDGDGEIHYWNLIEIDGKIAHFDSYCDAGFQGYPEYFGVNDRKMGGEHILLDDFYEPIKDVIGYRDPTKKSVG